MVSIDKSKERSLRKTAHHLEPVVWIGKNGISENVIKEIIQSLEQHELIKIKMLATEKKNQNRDIETICRMTNSILINSIGNILIIYKENNQ